MNIRHICSPAGLVTVVQSLLLLTAASSVAQGRAAPEPPTRAIDGLQALYLFDEGTGEQVLDQSGHADPLQLDIADVAATTWVAGGGLRINGNTSLLSRTNATRIAAAVGASNEITIEAWIAPADVRQDGPARIVSISGGLRDRNVTLGQGQWGTRDPDVFDVRLRTSATTRNGLPSTTSPPGTAQPRIQHIVYTRSASSAARLFVDGVQTALDTVTGDLANWDQSLRLCLANEISGDRPWIGTFHLVALYSKALSQTEVVNNYRAGVHYLLVPPDSVAPVITGTQVHAEHGSVTITVASNEPAAVSIAYGDNVDLGLSAQSSDFRLGHTLLLSDLPWSPTLYYRIEVADEAGNVTATRVQSFEVFSYTPPNIEIWHGLHQRIGHLGIAQRDVNISGNVKDDDGVASLTYRINGGPHESLTLGHLPTGFGDGRRLAATGDFTTDFSIDRLSPGVNNVAFEATDLYGATQIVNVLVERASGNYPLPVDIDWTRDVDPQDVGQYVDGRWAVQEDGLRTVRTGYDRLFLIGNQSWQDYEVTVPITLHAVEGTTGPNSGANGVGLLMRFAGHHAGGPHNWPDDQPKWGFLPYGGLGWLRWLSGPDAQPTAQFVDGGGAASMNFGVKSVTAGGTFYMKMRCETLPTAPDEMRSTRYYWKIWSETEPEPDPWAWIHTQVGNQALSHGGLALIAHHVDATFGRIKVIELASDPIGPVAAITAAPSSGAAPLDVTFSASGSYDADGIIVSSEWDFGDGTSGSGTTASHRYESPGTFTATLTVTDDDGQMATATVRCIVVPPEVARSRIVAHWPLDDAYASEITTETGDKHDARVGAGNPAWTDGHVDGATSFDGVRDYLSVPPHPNLDFRDALTIAGWFKHAARGGTTRAGVEKRLTYRLHAFEANAAHSRWVFDFWDESGRIIEVRTITAVENESWHHIAATFDGNRLAIYIDGRLDNVRRYAGKIRATNQPFEIGRRDGFDRYYKGAIDDLKLFGRSLNEEEIAALTGIAPSNAPPSVALSSPGSGAQFTTGSVVSIHAAATDPDDSVASVVFLINDQPVATVTESPFVHAWSPEPGVYRLAARAYDTRDGTATSPEHQITVNPRPEPSTIGLVAQWTFDDGTLKDESGHGHDGILIGNPDQAPGPSGTAFVFDGTADAVHIPPHPSFDLVDEVSVLAWFRNDPASGRNQAGVEKRRTYRLQPTDATGVESRWKFEIRVGDRTYENVTTARAYPNGAWHHIAGTFDGTALRIYVDGVLENVKAFSGRILSTDNPFEIGRRDGGRYFGGAIDDVRLYEAALDEAVIAGIAGRSLPSATPEVVILRPNSGQQFGPETEVTISALAEDADGSVRAVSFYANDALVGKDMDGSNGWSVVWTPTAGGYGLRAVATDDDRHTGESPLVQVTITATDPDLRAHWSFTDGSLRDLSGHDHHLEKIDAPRPVSGRDGIAFAFDGINDGLTVADANDLDMTDGLTLAGWFKRDRRLSSDPVAVEKRRTFRLHPKESSESAASWQFDFVDENNNLRVVRTSYSLPDGVWHHIAATFDGDTMRLFIDGRPDAFKLARTFIRVTDYPVEIGIRGRSRFFGGEIDDVRIYRRALSASEVQAIAVGINARTSEHIAVLAEQRVAPASFVLKGNYPNPFNPVTTIGYNVPEQSNVRLEVFDVTGRQVAVLVDKSMPAGEHQVRFDAAGLPSGLYLYQLRSGSFSAVEKMLLLR